MRRSIMGHYEKAWQVARQRIDDARRAASRPPDSVRLLAVSKTFPADAIRVVHGSGQRAFGENYVQEASAKRTTLAELADIEWHLIGPLQNQQDACRRRHASTGSRASTGARSPTGCPRCARRCFAAAQRAGAGQRQR